MHFLMNDDCNNLLTIYYYYLVLKSITIFAFMLRHTCPDMRQLSCSIHEIGNRRKLTYVCMYLIFSTQTKRAVSRHLPRIQFTPPRILRVCLIDRSPRYPPSSIPLPSNSRRLPRRRFRLFRDKNGRPGTAGMHLSNAGKESLSRYSNILPAHVRSRISNILPVSLARRTPRHSSRGISDKRLDRASAQV